MGSSGVTVLVVVALLAASPHAQNASSAAARINACTILTRELVAKATPPANKKALDAAPQETKVGSNGSYCDYGSLGLQIDPFARPDQIRKSPAKRWVPVSGVGDGAYFNNVQDVLAELIVWSGPHHFAIQIEVPAGSTAEAVKPKMIELANLIIPKLE